MPEIKKEDGIIIFQPYAGWTVDDAIIKSIDLAVKEKTIVKLIANDIVLELDAKSKFAEARKLFSEKINAKYVKTKRKG